MSVLTQNVVQWALPGGDAAQSSWWVLYSGNPTAPQALARFQTNVIDTIWPSGAGGMKGEFYSATVLNQVETRVVSQSTGLVLQTAKAAYSRAGTGTGGPLPNEVAEVVTLRTAASGASYRGRIYLPATGTGTIDTQGLLKSADVTTLVTQMANGMIAMNADVTYTSADCVVWSRKLMLATVITSLEVGTVFDAQRRRRNALVEVRTSAVV